MNNFTEEQRAKFEAWAKSQGYALNLTRSALNPSGYATVPTQGRWLAFYAGWTAALATPPAQGVEEETETLENLIDAAIGARTTPPWQEQAAQIRRDALEEAAKICDEMYVTFSSSMSPDRKNNKSWAMAANALADKIRALVRSEKGEGK